MSEISEEYLQFVEEYESKNPSFETHMEDLEVLKLIDSFFKGTLMDKEVLDFKSFYNKEFSEDPNFKEGEVLFYYAYWIKKDKEFKTNLN